MQIVKRFGPVLVSLALVLTLGGISIAVSASANRKAKDVHIDDRVKLNETLAGLTNQYIQFSFKEVNDAARSGTWSLRPQDPADTARLEEFIRRSALLNHGAVLLTLDGQPLNAFTNAPGLPASDDPGFGPLHESLAAGEPGLSSVMPVRGVPVVGLGVPVIVEEIPRALLVAFFRADTGPLQTYSERLDHGPNGIGYVLDARGAVVAATEKRGIGQTITDKPALAAALAEGPGFTEFAEDGVPMTLVSQPIGIGGWNDVVVQPAEDFFGAITEGGRHVFLALLVLLVVAALGLAVQNFLRERALRTAYEYKGQLLANSTHELKTPLTAIRGAAVTLGTRWRDMHPESVDQLLGMIHRRTEGLAKIADRILMGARLDAGRELTMTPTDAEVAGILKRIATEFADASPRHAFDVTAPKGLLVHVDEETFDQVVGMLIENAIKYSPDGGQITLEATSAGDQVVVNVTDEGIGIAKEDLAHVFEPYFRANRKDNQAFGGVGLGLSICRHLVELNGGKILVSSEPGRGTTFTVTVPRAQSTDPGRSRTRSVKGWVSVKQAAQDVGVHPSTVRSWLREGKVRSERIEVDGRARRLVAVEDLETRKRLRAGAGR